MSESVRKKIVFAALPLAIIWAVFNLPGRKPASPAETAPPPPQVTAPTQPGMPDPRLIDIKGEQAEPWGTGPFRCDTYRSNAKPGTTARLEWVLGGIIYSQNDPLAFINNQTVQIGDKVDDATVIAIDKRSVIIEHRGLRITLKPSKG